MRGRTPQCLSSGPGGWENPDQVFGRFKGGVECTVWYYQLLVEAIPERIPVKRALHDEVKRTQLFPATLSPRTYEREGNG